MALIDDSDRLLVLEAADDCELAYEFVRAYADHMGVAPPEALECLNERIERLSQIVPIGYHSSPLPYGPLLPIPRKRITLEEVVDPNGELVGPPFIHVSRTDQGEVSRAFDAFFEEHGFPDFLTKRQS